MLQTTTGIKFAHAQYRGSPAIITDLIGQHIDIGMDSMAAYVTNVQEGKIKALAIAGNKRWSEASQRADRVGDRDLPGFEASVWYRAAGAERYGAEIIAKLNAATNQYLASDKAKTLLDTLGVEIAGGTPDDLKAFTAAEIAKWSPIIKQANIQF